MSRHKIYLVFSLVSLSLCFISLPSAFSWGFHAHKQINREAIKYLPPPLNTFYNNNADYLAEHAIDMDKKKYVDPAEGHKHYIDVDHYGAKAFDAMPKYWKAATEKYKKDTLEKYGTLPWEVLYQEQKLTEAFKNKDTKAILKISADIGHYIADANVPLHTITNYNGQKTEQEGIHALWETAVPDAYSDKYKFQQGTVKYIKEPEDKIFETIKSTHQMAPVVLAAEKFVGKNYPGNKKYSLITATKKEFSPGYVAAYNTALNGMVERQMQESIIEVAAFWYTAWVNAGQPSLSGLKVQ